MRLDLRQSIAGSHGLDALVWGTGRAGRGERISSLETAHAHDAVACAAAYLYTYVAKATEVRDYIATYMLETLPHLSNRMDLA
jgi:hypothetical protein